MNAEIAELNAINTHDDNLELSEGLLTHLGELNAEALEAKWKKMGI